MPTSDYVRGRLIEVMRENGKLTHFCLLQEFGHSYRAQVETELAKLVEEEMLQRGIFKKLSEGKPIFIKNGIPSRGTPENILLGQKLLNTRCPLCNRVYEYPPALSTEYIRYNLLVKVRETGEINLHSLQRNFVSTRATYKDGVKDIISLLLSEGVLIATGIGRRGYPKMIQFSPIFPSTKCMMCMSEDTL